ncbi:MAG: penicillin-insensitive murein endopeptidase [Pseudomonadota bacterium]
MKTAGLISHFRCLVRSLAALVVLAVVPLTTASDVRAQSTPAKQLFGKQKAPADLRARAIGSYARGCLAGGMPLAIDGEHWQAMRLSRNRNWGHPALVAYLERFARDVATSGEWPGLLVGDMAQPRGGPMLTGHRSHQIGLDADIWLTPMPDRRLTYNERENTSAISVLKSGTRTINSAIWTEGHAKLIRRAARYDEVARIFVHPAIKAQLCQWERADADRSWLRTVRPWYGHHYHFHVRLSCPEGSVGCKNQDPPPPGDGCGTELAWWLGPEPWAPPKPGAKPAKPRPQLTLDRLPNDCRTVLNAGSSTVSLGAAALVPLPKPRPVIRPTVQ